MKQKVTKIQHHSTYEETLRKCERYILKVAYSLGQDDHKDDLCNEGRIGLYDAWKKYDTSTGPFHPFAISYIRFSMLNYLTKNARTIRVPANGFRVEGFTENVMISTSTDVSDDSNSTLGDTLEAYEIEYWNGEHFNDSIDDTEDAHISTLRQYLSELSTNYQKIFTMREIEGMSFVQIGEVLGMTRANASLSYGKAVKKLQEKFGLDPTGHKHKKIFPNGGNRKSKKATD